MTGRVLLDSPNKDGNPEGIGTGYYIGDGVILTAGHVIYEFNQKDNPANREIHKLNIHRVIGGTNDYLGYWSAYSTAVAALSDPHSVTAADIEVSVALRARDSILIEGSDNVDDDDAGLVVYLTRTDMVGADAGLTSGTTIRRDGRMTQDPSGEVTGFSSFSLVYNHPAAPGDSGGAFLLQFEGQRFVLGNAHSTNQTSVTYGAYFDLARFIAINELLAGSQSGDVTRSEPTNLIVGSAGSDVVAGTFRADIILGCSGADTLSGGDTAGAAAWANDQLFGGAQDDVLEHGRGADLLHGGDHRAYGGSRIAIEDDATTRSRMRP